MSPDRQVTTVACCQVSLVVGEVEANQQACVSAAERAVDGGARIIVLPELATSGYVFDSKEEARALAEPVSGPTVSRWTDLASRTGEIIMADCDLAAAADKTTSDHNDVLADRRPGLYRRLIEESPDVNEGGSR
jgi:5-aminopentanamidase